MDNVSPEQRSRTMRNVRSKDTAPELFVRKIIYRLGFRYRLHRSDLPGKPDIVFPGRKKIIFVHGCFWHRHANCKRARIPATNRDYWIKKIERNITRDQQNDLLLREQGWKILIVWECEVKDLAPLEKKVQEFLRG